MIKKILIKIIPLTISVTLFTLTGCIHKSSPSYNDNSNDTSNKVESNISKDTSDKKNNLKEITYSNEKLGFQIKIPASWKNHYSIQTHEDGIDIIFKSNIKPVNVGLLLCINKYKEGSDNFLDNPKIVNINKHTYIIGQSTDINIDPDNPEFNLYSKMLKEALSIKNSITFINSSGK